MRGIGLVWRAARRDRAAADRESHGRAILRLVDGLGIAAVLVVGLALQMQLLVLSDETRLVRIEEAPPLADDLDHISVEIWPSGEVWIQGRWMGSWVRDGRRDRWVGASVGAEIERLLGLIPEIKIQIDYGDAVSPDLVWRVVDQVGLERLMETYKLPGLPRPVPSPDLTA